MPCLNCIELNSSFYRIPSDRLIGSLNKLPDRIDIVIKASKYITHIKRLKDVEEAWGKLWSQISKLGPKLKCVLFQLPPSFNKTDVNVERIQAMKKYLPSNIDIAFEFRNKSWLEDSTYEVFRALDWCVVGTFIEKRQGQTWVGTMPNGLYMPPKTANYNYIRIHGKKGWKGQLSKAQLREIRDAMDGQAVRTSYVMFNNTFFDPRSGHCMVEGERVGYAAVCNAVEFADGAVKEKSRVTKKLVLKGGAPLPYNGDIQAAMRANDRAAIREIMASRAQARPVAPVVEEPAEDKGPKCFDAAEGGEVAISEALKEDENTLAFVPTDGQTSLCVGRETWTDDVIQKSLVKQCLPQGGYSRDAFVSLKKLGASLSDAFIPLQEFAGAVFGDGAREIKISPSGSMMKYISYGLTADRGVRDKHDTLWNYITSDGGEALDSDRYEGLSKDEQAFYDFLSVVSAAHCGHEGQIWSVDGDRLSYVQKGEDWISAHPDVLTIKPVISDRVEKASEEITKRLASNMGTIMRRIGEDLPAEVPKDWEPDFKAMAGDDDISTATLQRAWATLKPSFEDLDWPADGEPLSKPEVEAVIDSIAESFDSSVEEQYKWSLCNMVEELFDMPAADRNSYEPDIAGTMYTEGARAAAAQERAWDRIIELVDTGPSDDDEDDDNEAGWTRLFTNPEIVEACGPQRRTARALFDGPTDDSMDEDSDDDGVEGIEELRNALKCNMLGWLQQQPAAWDLMKTVFDISPMGDNAMLSPYASVVTGPLSGDQSWALSQFKTEARLRLPPSVSQIIRDIGPQRFWRVALDQLIEIHNLVSDTIDSSGLSLDATLDRLEEEELPNWNCARSLDDAMDSDEDSEYTDDGNYEKIRAGVCAVMKYLRAMTLEERNSFLATFNSMANGLTFKIGEDGEGVEGADLNATEEDVIAKIGEMRSEYSLGSAPDDPVITRANIVGGLQIFVENGALEIEGVDWTGTTEENWSDAFSGIENDYECLDDDSTRASPECDSLRMYYIRTMSELSDTDREWYNPTETPGEIAELAGEYDVSEEEAKNIFEQVIEDIGWNGWDVVYEEYIDACQGRESAMSSAPASPRTPSYAPSDVGSPMSVGELNFTPPGTPTGEQSSPVMPSAPRRGRTTTADSMSSIFGPDSDGSDLALSPISSVPDGEAFDANVDSDPLEEPMESDDLAQFGPDAFTTPPRPGREEQEGGVRRHKKGARYTRRHKRDNKDPKKKKRTRRH